MSSFRATVAVVAAMILLPRVARATPESDAKDLFARGRELRQANDCNAAAPLFRKAWTIFPQGLGSLRNLAECEELLGHYASSRRAWLDLKRALITMKDDPKYDGWDRDAEQAAARLKPKVASFTVEVTIVSPQGEAPANERSNVELLLNGESVGTALVGTLLERDPGTYRIRAQMPNAVPVEQTINVAAGESTRVKLRLQVKEVPSGNTSSTPTTVQPTVQPDDKSGRRTAGWILAAVGGAVAASSGVTFLLRSSALEDLDAACPSHRDCNESLRSTVDRGKTMSTMTSILLPTGLVFMAAGVVLVLTSPKPSPIARALLTGTF